VTVEAIEAAIGEMPAPSTNLRAFRWGRAAVAMPEAAARVTAPEPPLGLPEPTAHAATVADRLMSVSGLDGPLRELVASRVRDLVDYQDERLAARYLEIVERVRVREGSIVSDRRELSVAVARYLYKVLAYK